MSAYIVNREHILYLIEAAQSCPLGAASLWYRCGEKAFRGIKWYHGGKSHELSPYLDHERAREVAQMLWDANIHSVTCLYKDEPGLVSDDLTITLEDVSQRHWHEYDPMQVLMSCNCYNYQTCEDPEWEHTEAHSFIEVLINAAVRAFPGYEDCDWGAPKLNFPLVRKQQAVNDALE